MKALILMVVLVSAASAQAPATPDLALQRLAEVQIFAFGPVGFAGITSQGEKDYKAVLSRPSAASDFGRLLSAGNAQAKSYALVGIHAIDPEHFKTLSKSFRNSNADVTTESGCIVSHESLGGIFRRIEAGHYTTKTSPK